MDNWREKITEGTKFLRDKITERQNSEGTFSGGTEKRRRRKE